jgi:hypothetical protein
MSDQALTLDWDINDLPIDHVKGDNALEAVWELEKAKFDQIASDGMAKYAASIESIGDAFRPIDHTLCCMDERVEGGVHAAGSLMLVDAKAAQEFVERAGVTGITSHSGCGAAGLLYKREHPEVSEETLSLETLDAYARDKALELAEITGVPYLGHIPLAKMHGSPDFHGCRAIYYVGIDSFSPHAVPELPIGFVVDRLYHRTEHALQEVEIAISIVLGHHGFGHRITKEEAIYLIPVAATAASDQEMDMDELKDELSYLIKKYDGKVIIDGFCRS